LGCFIVIGCCSISCARPFDAPAEWQAVDSDLSNLSGTYANWPAHGMPPGLWPDVAPASRFAVGSEPRDRVAVDAPDGEVVLRFRLVREGVVLDEARRPVTRGRRHVALRPHSTSNEPYAGQRTLRVWLSVDPNRDLRVNRFDLRHSWIGNDGGRGGENRYERAAPDGAAAPVPPSGGAE
jgi:hypothetical protein